MANKRQKNKEEKINYLSFNNGSLMLLIGLILFFLAFISRYIFGTREILFYIQVLGLVLAYSGLILHFIFIGDKPFSKSWNFVKQNSKFVYIIIGIFLIFSLIGFFAPVPENLSVYINDYLRELFLKTNGMSQRDLIKFIFLNNLQSSFFGMIFGLILGIFPVFSSLMNGYILGFVASIAVETGGAGVLLNLLPHGIFELPAVFISLGLGLRLGVYLFKKKKENFGKDFLKSLRVFLFIVIPLLIIAAVIEGTLIVLG